jgi:hypothetical protein
MLGFFFGIRAAKPIAITAATRPSILAIERALSNCLFPAGAISR